MTPPASTHGSASTALAWLSMGTKADRRDAREHVIAYHQASLAALVEHVADAIDSYRAGEFDASRVDQLVHQYHRGAQELWKFCWASGSTAQLEFVADTIDRQATENRVTDWWQRGAPRQGKD
jgi:hypothetical protein